MTDTTARARSRVVALPDPRQLVARAAAEAGRISRVAVQLDNMFGSNARGLVQVVDILSHDAGRLAAPVKAGERAVSAPGFRPTELFLHGEAPPPGLIARLLAGDKIRKVDRAHLGPDAARRTKIWNTTLG